MRSTLRSPLLSALALLALPFAAGGCASDEGGGDPAVDGSHLPFVVGEPVTGNVHVTLRTWNPNTGEPSTHALVNESSEVGTKIRSGRASSTVTRVIGDEEMGSLLATMDEIGFSGVAEAGVTLESLPPDARRRGVIVVERDGSPAGLVFAPNMGTTAVPKVYRDCKGLILKVHMSVPGYAISAGTGDADPERTFQAPPIKMKR